MIKVLYTDDESSLLDIAKLFLEKSGEFSVTTATSAPEAIRLLEQDKFDAIISDYQMPEMDGIQFLVEVRSRFGPIPFILFTGRGREEIVIQAINSGADFYLQKGGDPGSQFAELSHKIKAAVSQRSSDMAFKESEERFRAISEYSHTAICIIDEQAKIVWANDRMQELGGYSPEQLYRTESFVGFLAPESIEFVVSNFQKVFSGAPYEHHYSFYFIRVDGKKRLCEKHMMDVVDSHGRRNLIISMIDVTDRKQAETALKHQSLTLSILNNIISMANKADSLPQLLDSILSESLRLLDFDAGGIYLVDRLTRTANIVHSQNLPTEFLAEIQTASIDKKPYDTLFIKNEPIITENYEHISPDRSKKYGFLSMASIPLLSKGVAIGALNVTSKRRQVISDDERQTLISISRELGSTIERMAAEEELKKSAKNLETLFNSIEEMVFVLDMQGRILVVNNTVLKTLSYTSEELTGMDVLQLHAPELRDEALRIVQGMIAGTNESCHVPVLAKDGTRIDVETKVTRGWWNGNEVLIGVTRDITERKMAEEIRTRFGRILESSLNEIYFFDAQTLRFVDVNHGARENIGYTMDELRTMTPLDITTEYTKESFETLLSPLRTGEKEIQVIFTVHKRKDGSFYPIEVHLQLAGNEISPLFVAIILDISERRQTEEALRLANWKLNLLSGITRHDINNQMTVLRGYISILEMKQNDPALNEYIQKMDISAQRISSMIQFTKEYEDLGITEPAWQEIRTLVTTAAKEISFGKIQVKNDLPAGMEIFSEPLIFKVFYNLMDNAVRYGETIKNIRFFVENRNGDRIIVCEDDGVGVPESEKEKIFLRGFGKNTGLGLALTQEILEITGISIEETGEPGKGARFEIVVPKGLWRFKGNNI